MYRVFASLVCTHQLVKDGISRIWGSSSCLFRYNRTACASKAHHGHKQKIRQQDYSNPIGGFLCLIFHCARRGTCSLCKRSRRCVHVCSCHQLIIVTGNDIITFIQINCAFSSCRPGLHVRPIGLVRAALKGHRQSNAVRSVR